MNTSVHRWSDVEPLPHINGDLRSILDSVPSLKEVWKTVVGHNTEAFHEARRRNLRRHAIETGVIERLYDVEWGVTQALVAEGITADAVATAGSLGDDVLETIQSQYDALTFLTCSVRDGRQLSVFLIKELHIALTRTQATYSAIASTGRRFDATLHHGEWKQQNNHLLRPDGSYLECVPPEHVASQIERLVDLYHQTQGQDPIVRSAWLHHRFALIHPFEDGHGRVARGLSLLPLLSDDLAPLVVDRRERTRYLSCLDQANDGDLRPLVRFFAELEIVALRSELERPAHERAGTANRGALRVLDAHIERLRRLHTESGAADRRVKIERIAHDLHSRVNTWLADFASTVEGKFRTVDETASAITYSAAPPDERSRWWRRQVITTARSVDFFVNIGNGIWWSQLKITVFGQRLRYLTFLQKVGHGESGVLTMTVYAEILGESDDARDSAEEILISSPTESVTWTFGDELGSHWTEVVELLDESLVVALDRFSTSLS